jgi:tetratricopeptide (TPR) repeat protein
MESMTHRNRRHIRVCARLLLHPLIVSGLVAATGCDRAERPEARATVDACAIALAPHHGASRLDRDIAGLQMRIRDNAGPVWRFEQLGWMLVAKARASFDDGYYRLAEQCAHCIESKQPGSPEALLLRGHVLHSLHKFNDGETVARELVAKRGLWFDYALLGDVLMEQGRLDEAIGAYQAMMDQKPGPQAYARAAHIRWLKGDLPGAIELMHMAAVSGEPWFRSRLALYEFQAGNLERAEQLAALPDYPPALLVRGRILLARGKPGEAIEALKRAADATRLPEYFWALAEAQRAAGKTDEAKITEEILKRHGATEDPRTFSLFLATRGEDVDTAVRLAREELQNRQDVFTLDALAWALHATGKDDEARAAMRRALAEGTQDARLALHAAVIFGRPFDSRPELLLPSERTLLEGRAPSRPFVVAGRDGHDGAWPSNHQNNQPKQTGGT